MAVKILQDLESRKKYGINVVAAKSGEEVVENLKPNEPLVPDEVLLVVGNNQKLLNMNKK